MDLKITGKQTGTRSHNVDLCNIFRTLGGPQIRVFDVKDNGGSGQLNLAEENGKAEGYSHLTIKLK